PPGPHRSRKRRGTRLVRGRYPQTPTACPAIHGLPVPCKYHPPTRRPYRARNTLRPVGRLPTRQPLSRAETRKCTSLSTWKLLIPERRGINPLTDGDRPTTFLTGRASRFAGTDCTDLDRKRI